MGGRATTSGLLLHRAWLATKQAPPLLSAPGWPRLRLRSCRAQAKSTSLSPLRPSTVALTPRVSTGSSESSELLVAQHEEIEAVVRVEHDLADVGQGPLPGRSLDRVNEVLLHVLLEAQANLAHENVFPGLEKGAL